MHCHESHIIPLLKTGIAKSCGLHTSLIKNFYSMKTILKSTGINIHRLNYPVIEKNIDQEIRIISFRRSNHNRSILKLEVMHLNHDNYRIFLNGQRLSLIISESMEYTRPLHLHNIDWKFYNRQTYEVLRNVIIWLPEVNMYLVKYYIIPNSQILKVILEKMS